jgi:hypothetical protein
MADHSVFSTAGRTPSAQMDADLSTLHAPEAAAEVVDESCRRVRERGQIDIVGSATCIDTATSAWQFVERPILAAKRSFGDRCLNRDNFESFERSVLPLHLATETACHEPDPMSAMRHNPENICSH